MIDKIKTERWKEQCRWDREPQNGKKYTAVFPGYYLYPGIIYPGLGAREAGNT